MKDLKQLRLSSFSTHNFLIPFDDEGCGISNLFGICDLAKMDQLEIKNLTLEFGGIVALQQVNMKVRKGEIHAVIGPNGAGKTSLFNCISGVYKPSEGNILFEGNSILTKSHIE